MTDKEKQRQLIVEIMKADEQSGLYDEPRVKLYTEEQVKVMIEKSRERGFTAEYFTLTTTPIQPPSDKEIIKEQERQMLIGLLDWMNKVTQYNPMALETDSEDIVEMYLRGYYTK